MPTFTGKTFSSFYKNILGMNQSGNTGVDATTRVVHDGAGQSTSISLSDDVLSVQPITDDTTATMIVKNQSGSNILTVDTTNSKILGGASQTALNTQYAYFGVDANTSAGFLNDTHYMIPFGRNGIHQVNDQTVGTGTNPDLTRSIPNTADGLVNSIWFIPDNITIDAVYWWAGADSSGTDIIRTHLMSYTIDSSNTADTSGALSGGVVLADSDADITSSGYEQAYYQSMTIQSADVNAGKVVVFTLRMDTVNSDYSINATVKYHIR